MVCVAGNKMVMLCEELADISAVEILVARIDVVLNGEFALKPTNMMVNSTVGILFAGAGEDLPGRFLHDPLTAAYRTTPNTTLVSGSTSRS
jgi:hypothetical protein